MGDPTSNAVSEIILPSAARTAEQIVEREGGWWMSAIFLIDVTVDPAAASLLAHIEGFNPANDAWETILTSAAIAAVGKTQLVVAPYVTPAANVAAQRRLPHRWRFRMAVADTASMTYSVGAWMSPTPSLSARAALDAAMTEDQLLTQVLELAKLAGWRAFHVRDSKRGVIQGGGEGFPDLVLAGGSPHRILFRELKRERGKLDAHQRTWGALLTMAGADWGVWRPSDWALIEATLRG